MNTVVYCFCWGMFLFAESDLGCKSEREGRFMETEDPLSRHCTITLSIHHARRVVMLKTHDVPSTCARAFGSL